MIVSCDGIKIDPSKVSAILKWPNLTNVKQIRAFLGLGNFYQHLIKDYAIIARPLTDLMCKDTPFTFGDCHGSTGSPSALSEEGSKRGCDGSRGGKGSS